ncbi:MAG: putative efflux protein [Firmicutes bacterium]|nr:putative efflux protein [Bacillota bacterium]
MRFLKDELTYFFSGQGMPYHKVSLMIAIVVTLLFSVILSNNYIKDGKIAVIDLDNSKFSHEFIGKMNASPYIKVEAIINVPTDPKTLLYQDKYLGVVYIPNGFEKKRYDKSENSIGVFYDNTSSAQTGDVKGALNTIVAIENNIIAAPEIASQGLNSEQTAAVIGNISINERLLFNPNGSSSNTMIIGFLFFFSSMFFVFAFIGMIARLRLVHKWEDQLLAGNPFALMARALPYCGCLLTGLFVGLGILRVVGDLMFIGNVFTFLFAVVLYVLSLSFICILFGWGAANPGVAISKMILFLPGGFILGGYTEPVALLPEWIKIISHVFPLTWMYHFTRDIILRGASFMDVGQEFGGLVIYTGILAGLVCLFFYRERRKLLQNA